MWLTNSKDMVFKKNASLVLFVGIMLIAVCCQEASAAPKTYTFTTTITAAPVVTMGTVIPVGTLLNYSIVNTGNQSNINAMTFTVPANYFLDPAMAGDYPTGWSASNPGGGGTITFTYTGVGGGSMILKNSGNAQTFILRLRSNSVPSLGQDSAVTPSSVKAAWANGHAATTYSTGNARLANSAWSVKSLVIVGLFAIDSVTGFASTAPNGILNVMLTVTNNSTGTPLNVNPPAAPAVVRVGVTGGYTGGNPPTFSWAVPGPGQSHTFMWTYTLTSACPASGSVSFTLTNISVGGTNGANNFTSQPGTFSAVATVGCFLSNMTISKNCLSSGDTTTITLTLTNDYTNNITGITAPPSLTGTGSATRTRLSGPFYSGTTVTANGGQQNVTWGYQITGAAGQNYLFTAPTVTGTLTSGPTVTVFAAITSSPTGTIVSPPVLAPTPSTIPADKNQMVDVSWIFNNTLCNPVNQVAITIPAGWVVSTTGGFPDASALITNAGVAYDDWNVSQTGATITFAAGTNLIVGGNANFIIFFSQVPITLPNYTFPIVVTDSVTGPFPAYNSTVAIGPAGGAGMSPAGLWGEQVR